MRKNQCKFCASRSCYTRIVTPDLSYDEVACRRHVHELEKDADASLNGALRCNCSSTGKLSRGEEYPAVEQKMHPTNGGLSASDSLSTPATISG